MRASEIPFSPASHELPSNPGCLKKVLAKRSELLDGRVQMINWSFLPPERSFREHYHEDLQEIFIIASGEAQATAQGRTETLTMGDAWIVQPGTRHSMRSLSPEGVMYVVLGISAGLDGKTIVTEGGL